MKQKTNPNLPLKRLTFSILLACSLYSIPGAYAETEGAVYKVQQNDTLSGIVIQHYQGYSNRPVIMQAILDANSSAFIDSDINRLIVGKKLTLPDVASIPNAARLPEPSPVTTSPAQDTGPTGSSSDLAARLATLEKERIELEARLKALETENATLKQQVTQFEQEKAQRSAELKRLEEQLKTLQSGQANDAGAAATSGTDDNTQAQIDYLQEQLGILDDENIKLSEELDKAQKTLVSSTQTTESLRAQLESLKTENASLVNDLQQARAVSDVKLGEKSDSGSSIWPWLLALLLAPLAWWFGRRGRQETLTTAPASETVPLSHNDLTASKTTANDEQAITTPITHGEDSEDDVIVENQDIPDVPDVALKLDMARAYLDLRDAEAANELLQEVLREGGTQQQQEAREILSFI